MAAENSGKTARKVPGRPFKPGQSGNPGGRPKAAAGWRERIRNDPALQDLAFQLAKGGEIDETTRVPINPDMVRYLLDQGFGRAPQTVKLEGMISIDEAVNDTREFMQQHGLLEEFYAWLTTKSEEGK